MIDYTIIRFFFFNTNTSINEKKKLILLKRCLTIKCTTVNSRYNVFLGTTEKKRYIKKKCYIKEFILNVGLHIDLYGTQYSMLNRARN